MTGASQSADSPANRLGNGPDGVSLQWTTAASPIAEPGPAAVPAASGSVIELPFDFASAAIELRGDDLFLTGGDRTFVIHGYGAALDSGNPPLVLDASGESLASDLPTIAGIRAVYLTEGATEEPAPSAPPQIVVTEEQKPVFNGALLTIVNPVQLLSGFAQVGALGGADPIVRLAQVPDFGGILERRTDLSPLAPLTPLSPFSAENDRFGVAASLAAGNVILGAPGGADVGQDAKVTAVNGVAVTPAGAVLTGQFGQLEIGADGGFVYQRTSAISDTTSFPDDTEVAFTYTLTNGDGRTATALLTLDLMPKATVSDGAVGTAYDEALWLQAGTPGTIFGADGDDRLIGTVGDDVLLGGNNSDYLQGGDGNDRLDGDAGNDTIDGGNGDDIVLMAGGAVVEDSIDGGAGYDTLALSGGALGFTFGPAVLRNVELVTLATGADYKIVLDDATNVASLTVDASALRTNVLDLDGSAETNAPLVVLGGAGDDVIAAGGGNDTLTAGAGRDSLHGGAGDDILILDASLDAADQVDGGTGFDKLALSGGYASGLNFGLTTVTNVELIVLSDGGSYRLILNDATNQDGLTIDAAALSRGNTLTVNGAAETASSLTVFGGASNDSLTGGVAADRLNGAAGNDILAGNGGADLLDGGAGNDALIGGTGADTFRMSLSDVGKDRINDFKLVEGDILELAQVVDGPGSDLQDLIEAGVTARGVGGSCTITWNGGISNITLVGVGGAVNSLSDLAALLGPQLHVTHA